MPEVVSCLQVQMCTRKHVATEKGMVEAIHKLGTWYCFVFAIRLPTAHSLSMYVIFGLLLLSKKKIVYFLYIEICN